MSVWVNHIKNKAESRELFEQTYIGLRAAEKRIYTDEEVALLPEVHKSNIYKIEWDIRKASCQRLVRYLQNKKKALKILEVGCGNGWFSHQLSKISFSDVVGMDINSTELQQAKRVFGNVSNLHFFGGDLNSDTLGYKQFDIIVFAASIQYFDSFSGIVESALDKLNHDGEIHILDTHFYKLPELPLARQRSKEYFRKIGFENMNGFYFHRSLEELRKYKYSILYDPYSAINKILGKKNPFHWISIKK